MLNVTEKSNEVAAWWRHPMVRWTFVPIASVAGGCFASLVWGVMQWIYMKTAGFSSDGWWYQYIVPIGSSAVLGYGLVYIGAMVAPRSQHTAGIVLASVWSTIGLMMIGIGLLSHAITYLSAASLVAQCIGCIVGAISTRDL